MYRIKGQAVYSARTAATSLSGSCADPAEIMFNVCTESDDTIKALAEVEASVVGYDGPLLWDTRLPDGTQRKLLDVSRWKHLGWQHRVGLNEGLQRTQAWYLNQMA